MGRLQTLDVKLFFSSSCSVDDIVCLPELTAVNEAFTVCDNLLNLYFSSTDVVSTCVSYMEILVLRYAMHQL